MYVNKCAQRFGSGSVPTHLIGAALLRGEWKVAVDMILDPRDGDILFIVSTIYNGWYILTGVLFTDILPFKKNYCALIFKITI